MPMTKKKKVPDSAIHGNVKYKYHELKKVGDFFVLENAEQRFNISSSLKNYNKKNNTKIAVTTRKTTEGVIVQRTA